ncbi:PucR family transcriptional regulator [Paenibacillus koleovorans]|uniref:PucR family transcriptional regulator n=1 Tax=Paenibacillus koleovorans TaxID=121608 RepID=UPI000FD9FD8F|nr:helix-turn-helix domain-containing protein [Paenibacillus koleovorans]
MDAHPFDRPFESLEALADTIYEVLRCPVTIEDANHRLLAYSSHDTETDPARTATIISRRVPEQVISGLWACGAIPKLMSGDEAVRISSLDDVGLGDRVAVAIRQNEETLGYIWLLDVHGRLDESGLRQLQAAAQAAKVKLLQLRQSRHKEAEEREELFWQLLTGHYKPDVAHHSRTHAPGITLPPQSAVVLFHLPAGLERAAKQQLHYLLTTTQRVRILLHVFARDQLIALVAPSRDKGDLHGDSVEFVHTFSRLVKERFQLAPLCAAVGSLVEGYASIPASYQRAQAIVKLKLQFPDALAGVLEYEELGYYRYMPAMLEQAKALHVPHRSLRKLQAYDAEHDSGLTATLRAFLAHNSHIKETAEALHVHVNTLTYRLKRIAEIGGIDLDDMDQKVSLYLEMKIGAYLRDSD